MKDIYSNIFSFNKKILNKSIANLKKGDVIGLPTETVYGLAANAYSKKSVKKIKIFLSKNFWDFRRKNFQDFFCREKNFRW